MSATSQQVPVFSGFDNITYKITTISGVGVITVRPLLSEPIHIYSLNDATTTGVDVQLPIPQNRGASGSMSVVYVRLGAASLDKNIDLRFIAPPAYSGVSGYVDYAGGSINGVAANLTFTKLAANSNNPYIFFIHSNTTNDYQIELHPSPPSYIAGDGITFTGTGPTTISNDLVGNKMTLSELFYNESVFASLAITATPALTYAELVTPNQVLTLSPSGSGLFVEEPGGNGRIQYKGVASEIFSISVVVSASTATGAKDLSFDIRKNGNSLAAPRIFSRHYEPGDSGSITLQATTTLDTDDYISIFFNQSSDSQPIDFEAVSISIVGAYVAPV